MLADKLLAKMDYDCDREIRTLELLKIRFGDSNMHNCEVSSKRAYPAYTQHLYESQMNMCAIEAWMLHGAASSKDTY